MDSVVVNRLHDRMDDERARVDTVVVDLMELDKRLALLIQTQSQAASSVKELSESVKELLKSNHSSPCSAHCTLAKDFEEHIKQESEGKKDLKSALWDFAKWAIKGVVLFFLFLAATHSDAILKMLGAS